MEIKVENTNNKNEVKILFKVEAEKFDNAIQKVFAKNAKYFAIPGFRKGKAPFKVVVKQYGVEIFYEDALNELIGEVYEKALIDNKVEAVSRPSIDVQKLESGSDVEFSATVQVKPEVKLGKYKGIELKKIEYNVTDEDVNHELGHMQERNARTVTVEDRAVKEKDIVTIDFDGYVDEKQFEGGKAENYDLEIGSNTFIPGFEDQVVGMKIDEEKDVKVTFPEEYFSKELAGKDAVFKVKVHAIKEKKLPELDDEFAKDVSEFDTLKELKEDIKTKKEKANEERVKNETESAAIEAVVNDTPIDVPSGMLEFEVENMMNEMNQQLAYQGLNVEQYLKILNKSKAEFEESLKPQAEKNVLSRLVIEAIIKAEKIEADDKEVEEKLKEMAESYGRNVEELNSNTQLKEYIAETIKSEKAVEFIVKNAKIK